MDKNQWKQFVDSEAVIIFMQGWEDRENLKKELRHEYAQTREQREVLVADGIEEENRDSVEDRGELEVESENYDDKWSDEEEEHTINFGEHRTVERGARISEDVETINANVASLFILELSRGDQLARNIRFNRRKQERKKRKRNQDSVVYS